LDNAGLGVVNEGKYCRTVFCLTMYRFEGFCSLLCSLFTHLFIVKGTGGSQAWRDFAGLVVVCSLKNLKYTTCQKALSPAKLYNAFYLYIVKRKFRKRILFENE
jgi:hypothetical protein